MAQSLSDVAPGVGHNGHTSPLGELTPRQMHELLEIEEELEAERKSLTRRTKEHHEHLDKLGVPRPAWKGFCKIRKEAGVIRDKNLSALHMLLAWDLKPSGLQASMDLTVSQGSPELNVHELHRVDNEGFEAGKNGKKRESNPYTPGTEAAQRFDNSWLRGQAEAVSKLATNPADAAAARRAGRRATQEELLAGDAPENGTRRRRRTREQIEADNAAAAAAAAERAANGERRRGRPPGSRNRPRFEAVEGGAGEAQEQESAPELLH